METAALTDQLRSTTISHFHLRWTPVSKQINFSRINALFTQMVNHFEGHTEVTTKNKMFRNVQQWHDDRSLSVFREMLPLTFCVKVTSTGGEIDAKQLNVELKQFKQCFKLLSKFKAEGSAVIEDAQPEIARLEMPVSHYQGKNAWILKPTGCNRGKGIHVVDSVKEVKKFIFQTCVENQSKVLQEKPTPETKTFVI